MRRGLGETISGDHRDEYHGIASKFIFEYAPPSLSTLLYEQGIGHTVRIYLDPLFTSYKHQESRTQTRDMTWNINRLNHLPARQQSSLIKLLSQRRRQNSFISTSIFIFKGEVQSFKYNSTKKKQTRRIGLVFYWASG